MQCNATKKDGDPCSKKATNGGFCQFHQSLVAEAPAVEKLVVEAAPEDKYDIARKRRMEAREKFKSTGAIAGQKLFAPQKKDFHRHWINDEDNRLEELLDKGYVFVDDKDQVISSDNIGTRKSKLVGTKRAGGPLTAYLMETPEKFYREDQQEKESLIQSHESQVRNAVSGDGKGIGSSGRVYNPAEGSNHLLE